MPIYEYACDKCDETMEVLQKLSDPAPEKCEYCGSKRLKRVMSQTSFQLKGDGWYITDYARKGKKDGDGGDQKEKKSDSKSESKKDAKDGSKKASKKDSKKAAG